MIDTIGNLDGTASGGGTKGTLSGVAFQYGTQLTALYSFGCSSQPCTDAQVPETGMVLDASGNLWGTSTKGGDNFEGALFEVCPGGSC